MKNFKIQLHYFESEMDKLREDLSILSRYGYTVTPGGTGVTWIRTGWGPDGLCEVPTQYFNVSLGHGKAFIIPKDVQKLLSHCDMDAVWDGLETIY